MIADPTADSAADTLATADRVAALVAANVPLAQWAAGRYIAAYPQHRDVIMSGAYVGLWRACRTYQAGRRVKFSHYAAVCIRRAIVADLDREIRVGSRFRQAARLDQPDDDDDTDALDVVPARGPGPADLAELRDEFRRVDRLLAELPPARREIIRRYYAGERLADIGAEVGRFASALRDGMKNDLLRLRERAARLRAIAGEAE